jgi:CheY-like chemotaxis protein
VSGALSGKRVLVVEDEMTIMLMIVDALLDMGCTSVLSAATVDQAMVRLEAGDIDVALLDINLNGSSSYPVADRLIRLETPFIFSTGYGADRLPSAYDGVVMLRKPYPFRELENALERVLRPVVSHAAA